MREAAGLLSLFAMTAIYGLIGPFGMTVEQQVVTVAVAVAAFASVFRISFSSDEDEDEDEDEDVS